jgi:crotonobetainyl-CoA:carnitine CoA-transferase CaiB-like acyl-CoA transferase
VTTPLAGTRVLDITTSLSGPLAAGILADLGAQVIKIERPGAPDRARFVGTREGDISAMFHMANRGKRSIALDLRDPADAGTARALAREADVLVENFRPGVTQRLGIDYASLSALNGRLVYVSISGFGSTGPYAGRPAFDSLLQAYGGISALQAGADGEPQLISHAIVDKAVGLVGAQSALAALLARERTGSGQHVDVSMFEVAAWFVYLDAAGSSTLIDAPKGLGDDATSGMRMTVRFADGWGMLSLGHDDSFRAACEVFGIDLADRPQLATLSGRTGDPQSYDAVLSEIRSKAAGLPRSATSARLLRAGAMFAEILHPADIPANEQAIARRLFVESVHPTAGRVVEPRLPSLFSATPLADPGPSPALGQHGDQVRAELPGVTRA